MSPSSPGDTQRTAEDCTTEMTRWQGTAGHPVGSTWTDARAERVDGKARLAGLMHTLHHDVIPRLAQVHAGETPRRRGTAPADGTPRPPPDIGALVRLVLRGSDDRLDEAIRELHLRGASVAEIYTEALTPMARRLGEMWEADECDFSSVTIALGRLQRILREWSPAFGAEVQHPPNGRRLLLAQHPDEQHSFGLSMVAEFFRRDGWEVLGGVGGAVNDPSKQVATEWFDAAGFSVGSETRLEWLHERVVQLRRRSRNRQILVMVGGPLFTLHPEWLARTGADVVGRDGAKAPQQAEAMLAALAGRGGASGGSPGGS